MKNDIKIGIIIGMVLVIGIILTISLWPGQSMDQRHKDSFQEEELDLPITLESDQPQDQPESSTPETQKKTSKTPPKPSVNSPAKTPTTPPKIHTVTSGDTLSSISMKHYGTTRNTQKILDANKSRLTDKDNIRPGMRLIIPNID